MTKDNLNDVLYAMLGSRHLVDSWWQSPNKAFDNKCPCDVELSKVEEYIMWYAMK